MRNLQKILALALALIMSFSLVVTANAAFSDEADITDTYNEAVNVLSQLEVFKGYTDGTYQPQKSITRAEVAAIIYRIATGDVTDTQVSIYSDWNRFTDVHAGEWWAGYINYCANAEYIKGYGNGKFGPDDPVTGYEALAMILRAVGYGKMDGEFQGSDWAVQTAARANTLKVTKNVQNSALLNSAATRELVAELLFRSILVPTVEYNQFSGYTENDTTLGYQSFKLEAIEGVVVANEYANLYDIQVLDAGKTDFEVAKDDVRSLNIGSELTAVGEAHYAYVSGSTVYALENTGDNTVWEPENGKGTKVSDGLKAASLKKNDDTEYYINFGREGHFSCDQRLEFQVTFFHVDAIDSFPFDISKYAYDQNGDDVDTNDWTVEYVKLDANGNEIFSTNKVSENADKSDYVFVGGILQNDPDDKDLITGYEGTRFNRIIRAGQEITNEEMEIIQGIFAVADNEVGNGQPRDQVTGDVFVGTKSTNSATDEERDVSNTMSFRKFKDEYINSEAWDQDVDKSDNGEWLKIVDNDGDGVAEYVFLTEYTLDKAVSSYTKSGETVLEFNSMDIEYIKDNDGIVDYKDEIAVGDVVYYTQIDNRFTITKAPVVKATIKTVNFKDESCTTTEDATYTESGIENKSHLDQEVENLDDKVEYNLYFDAYGWLRAYELANGNTYGLITELYKTTTKNDQYVKGEDLTVELKKGSAKIDEFDVDNSKGNVFLLSAKDKDNGADIDTWDQLRADLEYKYFTTNARILLQPAIGQLGQWNVNRMVDTNIFHQGEKNEDNVAPSYATTNVAVYTEAEDGEVRLTSPVKLAKNVKGEQMYYTNDALQGEKDTTDRGYDHRAYEVDYIALDLSTKGVTADMRHYPIHEDSRYANQSRYNNYVDAVHDTQFYVVNVNTKKNIDYFTDYEKVYAIGAENILAAYAVARNTETDYAKNDYWVADVIVIEVSGVPTTFDSVGLLYNNPSQTSGSVKRVESYNSESENPRIDMILDNGDFDWAPRYNGSWVYEIDEDKIEDGDLYANDLDEITENYNAKGIYAGIVSRIKAVNTRGGYIDVLIPGSDYVYPTRDAGDNVPAKTDSISVTNDELFAITSKNGADDIQTNTRSLRMTEGAKDDRLEEEHRVLWVEDKDGHVAFVIDVDFVDDSQKTPHWLGGDTAASLWFAVAKEQVDKQNAVTFDDALKAYNDWVKNPTNETLKKAAISAVKAALENNPTASQKEHLNEMLNNLNKGEGGEPEGTEGTDLTVKNAADEATYFDTTDNDYKASGRKLKMTISDAGSLEDYIGAFAIPAGAEVDWTFSITGGREYAVTSTPTQWNKNNANVGTIRISDLQKVKAILKLADGSTKEYNSDVANWIEIKLGTNISAAPSKSAAVWSTAGTAVKAPKDAVLYFKSTDSNKERGGTFYGVTDGWTGYATGSASAAVSDTGYTVSGKDSITFAAYPEVTLASAGGNSNVTLPTTVKAILKNGETSCTFTVKVNDGYRITADNGATVARGKAVTGGYEWTVTKTGVTADVTITVTEAGNPKITVTVPADGKIAMVNGTLPTANTVDVVMEGEQTSGTLTLLVETGLKPKISSGDSKIFTTSFEKKEAVGVNTKWEISYTGVTTNKAVTLATEAEAAAPAPSTGDFDSSKITKDEKKPITDTNLKASITLEGETTSNFDYWKNNGYNQAVDNPDEPVAFYLWSIRDVIPSDKTSSWGTITSWKMEVNNPAYSVIYPSGHPHGETYTTTINSNFDDTDMAVILKSGSTVTMKFTPCDSSGEMAGKTVTVTIDASGLTIAE